MKTNKLTIKQEAFCQAFIKHGEASKAYRESYNCSNLKDKSVWELSSSLLKNIKVASRIEELQKKFADIADKKFEINAEEILRHLNILRKARIDEYVEYKKGKLIFKDFDKLTKEQLMCIESIKQDKFGNVEIKLHGKEWTIEKINKHIGFYALDNRQKGQLVIKDSEEREARITSLIAKAMKQD